MSEQFDRKQGLQLWTPRDSFETPLNKVVFENLLARLQIVDVQFVPEEEGIYCVSGGMAYEAVTPLDTAWRLKSMTATPLTHCFQPDLLVEAKNKDDEATARELQLALARTSLKAGIFAESKTDYEKAFKDLIEVFRDVKINIHTKEQLEQTDLLVNTDLLKSFIEASKRHKTVTPMQARTVASMLGHALLPVRDRRTKKIVSWHSAYGHKIAENLTSKQPAKKTVDEEATGTAKRKPHVSSKGPQKVSAEYGSQGESYEDRFYSGLRIEGFPRGAEQRRKFLKDQILVEGKAFPVHNEVQKLQTIRLGFSAYLEKFGNMSLRGSSRLSRNPSLIANQTLEYVRHIGGKKILRKILTIGNLFAAKINEKNKNNPGFRPIEVPGIDCDSDSLLRSFQIVRSTLIAEHAGNADNEPEEAKDIAEILEAYIKSHTFDYRFSDLPRFNMRNDRI